MSIKQKKGISLIVLIITIIVMIILATAIILSLNGSGIIGKAKEAKTESDEASIKEAASLAYAEYDLAVKTGETVEGTADEYVKERLKEEGILEEVLKLLQVTDDGKIYVYKMPIIPEGFVASDIETEDDVLEGLVIYEGTEKVSTDEDAMMTRDQYVWVPVPEISEFVRKDGYQSGVLQNYVTSGKSSEPMSKANEVILSETNDLTGEYAEYTKMRASVEKYGGFYIARYEAGTSIQRIDSSNGTSSDILFQKDKYAYNYVAWGPNVASAIGDVTVNGKNQGKGAVELARSIYSENSNNDIVSTLCYGVQWDAIMTFMKEIENPYLEGKKYIEDSTSMGWYRNNKSGNTSQKTGRDVDDYKSNMIKNIYDMAGNVHEWTMEGRYIYDNSHRFPRGGSNNDNGSVSSASNRDAGGNPGYASSDHGFRVALYLK